MGKYQLSKKDLKANQRFALKQYLPKSKFTKPTGEQPAPKTKPKSAQ